MAKPGRNMAQKGSDMAKEAPKMVHLWPYGPEAPKKFALSKGTADNPRTLAKTEPGRSSMEPRGLQDGL